MSAGERPAASHAFAADLRARGRPYRARGGARSAPAMSGAGRGDASRELSASPRITARATSQPGSRGAQNATPSIADGRQSVFMLHARRNAHREQKTSTQLLPPKPNEKLSARRLWRSTFSRRICGPHAGSSVARIQCCQAVRRARARAGDRAPRRCLRRRACVRSKPLVELATTSAGNIPSPPPPRPRRSSGSPCRAG